MNALVFKKIFIVIKTIATAWTFMGIFGQGEDFQFSPINES